MATRDKDAGLAAVFSLMVPGVGQFYAGRWGWGIFWLIATPGFWIGSGGFFGWVCHVASAIQAHGHVKSE